MGYLEGHLTLESSVAEALRWEDACRIIWSGIDLMMQQLMQHMGAVGDLHDLLKICMCRNACHCFSPPH